MQGLGVSIFVVGLFCFTFFFWWFIFWIIDKRKNKKVNDEIAKCNKQFQEAVAEYYKLRDIHIAYVKVMDEHIVLLEQSITLKDKRIKFLEGSIHAANGKSLLSAIEGEKR